MSEEVEDLKRRVEALEGKSASVEEKVGKVKKPPSAYNKHMSETMARIKEECNLNGTPYDHKAAFKQAAAEWKKQK
jgi:peptidoglycan hydrolase CwlO-like protein